MDKLLQSTRPFSHSNGFKEVCSVLGNHSGVHAWERLILPVSEVSLRVVLGEILAYINIVVVTEMEVLCKM